MDLIVVKIFVLFQVYRIQEQISDNDISRDIEIFVGYY
jgi:hypothetical protein